MMNVRTRAVHKHWTSTASQTVARTLGVVAAAGLVLATAAGCAQNPTRDRDLNAEAMRHMNYWDNDPRL